MEKRGQISIEYIIIVGFVTFVIIGILGMAFFYSAGIKDRIKIIQINNFANKIIYMSESVFYSGAPSKATFNSYLPQGVQVIDITPNILYITVQVSSGVDKMAFPSNVPLSGSIGILHGVKKIEIKAEGTQVAISQI